jgi:transposase
METKRVKRRRHSDELRAEVVQACRQPGASVAAIALRNGLNANVVYRWLKQTGEAEQPVVARKTLAAVEPVNTFVPVAMVKAKVEPAPPPSDIRIELRRGAASVTVSWPLQGAGECATWLRDWLR